MIKMTLFPSGSVKKKKAKLIFRSYCMKELKDSPCYDLRSFLCRHFLADRIISYIEFTFYFQSSFKIFLKIKTAVCKVFKKPLQLIEFVAESQSSFFVACFVECFESISPVDVER